jgi:hypothetical protein
MIEPPFEVLNEFISSHILAYNLKLVDRDMYVHDPEGCKHCEAKAALGLLESIIERQQDKIDTYIEALALQSEMHRELQRLYRELDKRMDEAEADLASCNVELHNSKQHQLGLMCAEQTDKLNKIQSFIDDRNRGAGLSAMDGIELLKIIDGND